MVSEGSLSARASDTFRTCTGGSIVTISGASGIGSLGGGLGSKSQGIVIAAVRGVRVLIAGELRRSAPRCGGVGGLEVTFMISRYRHTIAPGAGQRLRQFFKESL